MLGLTTFGVVHTLISLVALITGVIAFIKFHEIRPESRLGQAYIWTTVATCVTGFGIFQHGGFGKPHALGVVTLLVLGAAWLATRKSRFGSTAPVVATVSMSLTFFLHLIPGVTETFTRLPAGSPLFSSPEDSKLQAVVGGLFVVFLFGATLQIRRIRARSTLDGVVKWPDSPSA